MQPQLLPITMSTEKDIREKFTLAQIGVFEALCQTESVYFVTKPVMPDFVETQFYPDWQFQVEHPSLLSVPLAMQRDWPPQEIHAFWVTPAAELNELAPAEVLTGKLFDNPKRDTVLPALEAICTMELVDRARLVTKQIEHWADERPHLFDPTPPRPFGPASLKSKSPEEKYQSGVNITITAPRSHNGKTHVAIIIAKALVEAGHTDVTVITDSTHESIDERLRADNYIEDAATQCPWVFDAPIRIFEGPCFAAPELTILMQPEKELDLLRNNEANHLGKLGSRVKVDKK